MVRPTPLALRLEELTARLNCTQADVATATGVRQQTVSRWLSGDVTPTRERLAALERFYGTAPGELARLLTAPATDRAAHDGLAASGLRVPDDLTPDEARQIEAYVSLLVRARQK